MKEFPFCYIRFWWIILWIFSNSSSKIDEFFFFLFILCIHIFLTKEINALLTAPLNQSRTRRDSNNSNTSEVYSDEKEEKPAPPSPRKDDAPAKMVPAPPPKENIWERRKTEQKSGKDHSYNEVSKDFVFCFVILFYFILFYLCIVSFTCQNDEPDFFYSTGYFSLFQNLEER